MAEDNSVQTEKVWHVPYNDNPKHMTVVHKAYNQYVLDQGSSIVCVHQDDVYPSEEAALQAIYEKKYAALSSSMKQVDAAKKALDDHRKAGKK